MLVSFKGTVLDGDSTSGLLRQHLATEFEDDDIVMYVEFRNRSLLLRFRAGKAVL